MNTFELSISIILNAVQSGKLEKPVSYYFDIAETVEKEAIKRKFIEPKVCNKCQGVLEFIDLDGQWRVKCDCIEAAGDTRDKALTSWMEK